MIPEIKRRYGITIHQTAYTGGNMPTIDKIVVEERSSCHDCIEIVAVLTSVAANEELAKIIVKNLNDLNLPYRSNKNNTNEPTKNS
jgi:hypothetical protein